MMLDNVTRNFEDESCATSCCTALTEGSRASLANMQAAVEMLATPTWSRDARALPRRRPRGGAGDEPAHRGPGQRTVQSMKTRWPLEDMLRRRPGRRRASPHRAQLRAAASQADEVDAALWLRVDSFSLLQALSYLARRLVDEFDVARCNCG